MSKTTRPKAVNQSRQRYCELRANNLAEVLVTCERHITNIGRTQLDLLEEGDGTPNDDFYCGMMRGMWQDMRDDVKAIIEAGGQATAKPSKVLPKVAVIEMTERDRMMGPRPDGYIVFASSEEAVHYMDVQTKGRKLSVPDEYIQYEALGFIECSVPFYERLATKEHLYIDKLAELKGA